MAREALISIDLACSDRSARRRAAGGRDVRVRSGNRKESGGVALLVAVLLASFVLVAVLALQAYTTAIYQRATAERALRDYATWAAEELVRRAASAVGFSGYYPVIAALHEVAGEATAPTALEAVATRLPGDDARPLGLVRTVFLFDAPSATLDASPALDPPLEAWLRDRLAALVTPAEGRQAAFTTLTGEVAGEPRRLVVGRRRDGSGFVGFEVEPRAVGTWIGDTLAAGPLLPGSLAAGEVGNEALCLAIVDQAGREQMRSGDGCAPALTVEVPFGRAYEGVLDGLTVRAAVRSEAARRLVLGGLPASRLPLLAVQLALAAALAAAGVVLLRREQAMARLRSDFVSRVSHELRTPLTQIRLFAETLLLGRVRSDDERRRALVVIDQEARRLSHLVDNVLEFARGERGELRLSLEERELAPLVAATLDGFAPIAQAAGAKILSQAAASAPSPRARVDPGALRQMLLNLLDNAVKYGPRGQTIRVGLDAVDGVARLSVEDGGPGVPAAARERVFRPYERLDRESRSAVAGTGIGLAVVRELARAHGGGVRIEDAAGGGARFVVELPTADPAEVPA